MVIDVIRCLLSRNNPVNLACVKLKMCHMAMECSDLAQIIGDLLDIINWKLYPYVLDLTLLLISISDKNCLDIVNAKAIDAILLRLDPNCAPVINPVDQTEIKKADYTRQVELAILSTSSNILWRLMISFKPLSQHDLPPNVPVPSQSALWSIRHQLCLETLRKDIRARNDMAGVIVLALEVFPDMLAVESGLVEAQGQCKYIDRINPRDLTLNMWSRGNALVVCPCRCGDGLLVMVAARYGGFMGI
ncbi:uncharacterized protein [Periplaneta americana]|uniref:uncharacterized protein n=1 Tax=Periplaneta americana TaxID=6978 RepID=UPI0037E7B4A4